MAEFDYDVAIIGAGPGGYVAGIRAGQLGLKAVVIEKDKLGGVCLNIGCIPSKAIIHRANLFRAQAEFQEWGIKVDRTSFDYGKIFASSRKAADTLSKGVAYLLKKNNVQVISGTGTLSGNREVQIDNGQKIGAAAIIIATGSRPRIIPGFEFDGTTVLSSDHALMLEKLPSSMLILGAGAIGVEFAHIMNAFGVEVHLVEMLEHILPLEDREITEVLARSFKKRGIKMYTSARALSMDKKPGGVSVLIEDREKKQSTIDVEQVLVVTGRVPNTENIGIEKLGIPVERGFIQTGDFGETSVKGIYAIGDVVPTPLLAHVASREGEMAVEHIAGKQQRWKRVDPLLIPGAVYCEPQIASFGLTVEKAGENKVAHKVSSFPFRGAGKAVAIGEVDGMVKLLTDPATGEILGAHVAGADATEFIHELLLAKTAELLPSDIADTIHAHPTLSETVLEAARIAAHGQAIHI